MYSATSSSNYRRISSKNFSGHKAFKSLRAKQRAAKRKVEFVALAHLESLGEKQVLPPERILRRGCAVYHN